MSTALTSMNSDAKDFLAVCGVPVEKFLEVTKAAGCSPEIVLGVIKTESGGDADAMRFETGYPYLFETKRLAKEMGWTEKTEVALQSFSFGLMQIMLATARSHGFEKHPMQLLSPVVNLSWGALHLGSLVKRYQGWHDAVSAYNQGSPRKKAFGGSYRNQEYVDKVFRHASGFYGIGT